MIVYFETLFYAQKIKKNSLKIVLISKSAHFDSIHSSGTYK